MMTMRNNNNNTNSVTIRVFRPMYGVDITSCSLEYLEAFPVMKIFPDNMGRADSSFPGEGVTITSTKQGHLVVAYQHIYEKWILSGGSSSSAVVDLGTFSEYWKGCSVTFCFGSGGESSSSD